MKKCTNELPPPPEPTTLAEEKLEALEEEELNAMQNAERTGAYRWKIAKPFVYTVGVLLLLGVCAIVLYIALVPSDSQIISEV